MTLGSKREHRERCPACNSAGGNESVSIDHERGDSWLLRRCPGCGTWYVADPPAADDLRIHYDQDSGSVMHSRPTSVVERARFVEMRRELRPLLDRLQPADTVLDLGTGDGSVARLMQSLGFSAIAADLYPESEWNPPSPTPYVQVSPSDFYPQECPPVDGVIMRHVFEHLPEPGKTLRAIKESGARYVLLVVPNGESRWSRHFGDSWYYWDPPRHLTHFSRAGLRLIAKDSGFRVEHLDTKGIDEFVVTLHRRNRIRSGPAWATRVTRPTGALSAAASAVSAPFGHGVLRALLASDA